MDDITVSLLVIAGTAIVVALIFFLVNRQKKKKRALIQALATRNGWEYEEIKQARSSGYRLSASDWTMESVLQSQGADVEPHLSNISKHATFTSSALFLPGRNVFIGPATPNINIGAFGEALREKMFQKYLGHSGLGLQEVKAGSSGFLQKFMILANDPNDVSKYFSPACENLMMRWKDNKPVVKITQTGLEVHIENTYLDSEQDIQAFIDLGKLFLSANKLNF